MKKIVELYDEYDDTRALYELSTVKGKRGSLEEFEKIYNEARNEWYENCEGLDCLFGHIQSRLIEKGYGLSQINVDLQLYF